MRCQSSLHGTSRSAGMVERPACECPGRSQTADLPRDWRDEECDDDGDDDDDEDDVGQNESAMR